MTIELQMLAFSVVLGLMHLVLYAQLANHYRGYRTWAAGPRDYADPPLPRVSARIERAYRNYLETFPIFVAVVLAAHVTDTHSWMTAWGAQLYFWGRLIYLPAYVSGIGLARSLIWNVPIAGIILILVAIILAI